MTKRCIVLAAAGFLLGVLKILLPDAAPFVYAAAVILLVAVSFCYIKDCEEIRGIVCVFAILVSFFLGISCAARADRCAKACEAIAGVKDTANLQGRIYKKEIRGTQTVCLLDHVRILYEDRIITCRDVQVYFDEKYTEADLILGNTVVLRGTFGSFNNAKNPGNYDEEAYFKSLGVYLRIEDAVIVSCHGRQNTLREYLYRLRRRMGDVIALHMPPEKAGTLSSMVLGDKSSMDKDIKGLFQGSGLSHLLSVSGLHVSLVCMGLYRLLRLLLRRLHRLLPSIIAVLFSITYCLFTGASVSTIRAVGMFSMLLAGSVLGECYDSLTGAAVMSIVIVSSNPESMLSAGFLLSFGAVIGAVTVGKELTKVKNALLSPVVKAEKDRLQRLLPEESSLPREKIRRLIVRLQKAVTSSFILSLSIQAATLPLVFYYFHEAPTLSVLVNLIVIPFAGVLLIFGMLGSLAGLVRIGIFSTLSGALFIPCRIILSFYEKIASAASSFTYGLIIAGKPHIFGIMAYYAVLIIILKALSLMRKKSSILPAAALFPAAALLAVIMVIASPSGFEITMLDVGQGDGIFIRSQSDAAYFIDGGSSGIKQVGTYRILPFLKCRGAGHIDYWFVSHPDEDHVSGLIEILKSGYRIDNIVFSAAPAKNDNYNELITMTASMNIPVLYMSCGNKISGKDMSFTCLYPPDNANFDNSNDGSLVLLMETDEAALLLTGDISSGTESALMADFPDIPDDKTRILKVSHHGSKNSSSEAFLQEYSPNLALISVGERNTYGHPHKNTLRSLDEAGAVTYRTDKSGAITIKKRKNRLYIQTFVSD